MILDVLFLPFVFFIGLVTSYQDMRYGKVRNKWILWGSGWAAAVLLVLAFWSLIAEPVTHFYYFRILKWEPASTVFVFTVPLIYIGRTFLNALTALLVGFLLWRFNVWAAGDAKLFFVYALLIPLNYYWKSYFHFFPSFVLLVNIFMPVFFYLLARAVFHHLKSIKNKGMSLFKKEKKEKRNFSNSIKRLIFILLILNIFLGLALLDFLAGERLPIDVSSLRMLTVAGLIIGASAVIKWLERPYAIKAVIAVFVILLTYGSVVLAWGIWLVLWSTLKGMAVFMAAFTVIRGLVTPYIAQTGREVIAVKDLKMGMNLTEEARRKLTEKIQRRLGTVYTDGLTVAQTALIKERLDPQTRLEIYRPFTFVAWMFFGVIVTLVFKGSVVHLLSRLF